MIITEIISGAAAVCLYVSTFGALAAALSGGRNLPYLAGMLFLAFCSMAVPDAFMRKAEERNKAGVSGQPEETVSEKGIRKLLYTPVLLLILLLIPVKILNGFSTADQISMKLVISNAFVLLPPAVLLILKVKRKAFGGSYERNLTVFRIGIAAYPASLLMMAMARGMSTFIQETITFYIAFLVLTVWNMRLLRAPEFLSDRRFRTLNLIPLAVITILILVLGNHAVLSLIGRGLSWVYRHILAYGMIGVLGIALGPLALVLWGVFSLVKAGIGDADASEISEIGLNTDQLLPEDGAELHTLPPWIGKIFIILLVLLALFVIVMIIRRIVEREGGRGKMSDIERTDLGSQDGRSGRKHSRKKDPVRHIYEKYLKYCREKNIDVSGALASDRIEEASRDYFDPGAARDLRNRWLRVRYGEKPSTEEDVREAKEDLRRHA